MVAPVTIVDIQEGGTSIQVVKDGEKYFVFNGDVLRHPNCDADSALRALGHYLQSFVYKSEQQLATQKKLDKAQLAELSTSEPAPANGTAQ